jgi:hypothetical protein
MKPELRGDWVRMFREEHLLRVGHEWEEGDAEAFFQFYGDTPHEAVSRWIEKYDLTDLTAGKTVYYVVIDEDDGAFLVENDPGEDMVMWAGTDKFEAECHLCKCCE